MKEYIIKSSSKEIMKKIDSQNNLQKKSLLSKISLYPTFGLAQIHVEIFQKRPMKILLKFFKKAIAG